MSNIVTAQHIEFDKNGHAVFTLEGHISGKEHTFEIFSI